MVNWQITWLLINKISKNKIFSNLNNWISWMTKKMIKLLLNKKKIFLINMRWKTNNHPYFKWFDIIIMIVLLLFYLFIYLFNNIWVFYLYK